jgi:hypothetical protein
MTIVPTLRHDLLRADGFQVLTADLRVGVVEEIWIGEDGAPTGLAVRTADGTRGLVLADDVAAVDAERRWVVVPPEVRVLRLEPPRLVERSAGRVEAAWSTNGETLPLGPEAAERPRRRATPTGDPPLVRSIVLLYAGLAVAVVVIMTLAFLIPYLAA